MTEPIVPTIPFYPITHDDGINIVSALSNINSAIGELSGPDTGWSGVSNSGVFSGTIYYRKSGKIVTLRAYNITLASEISNSGGVTDLITLGTNYCPIYNAYGFCFSPNLEKPAFIIFYPAGVIRFSCGANSGWSTSKTISFNMSVIVG